tara:strand:+ start:125 stop:808 length:684 start_codon:yes stop_codon:yes gene_type:complete
MTREVQNQIDILQKRRIDSHTKRFTITTIKKLRRRGIIYGCIISFIGVSVCTLTSIHTFRRIKYKEKLITEALEYQDLKTNYELLNKNFKQIYSVNNNISQGIIGTKSSSVLLLELQKIIPTTIQISNINSTGKKLIIKGKALQPNALDSINLLKLKLSNSFLIDNNSTFISDIRLSKYREKDTLNFTLNSEFEELDSKQILSNFAKLGSLGLLKRVKILKEEGLIR